MLCDYGIRSKTFIPHEQYLTQAKVQAIATGHYRDKEVADICGSGYCVHSLEAALWCVELSSSFDAAVLQAANLGDDADTTATIAGQIAGALNGVQAIPERWRKQLYLRHDIERLAQGLYHAALGE